MLPLLLSTPWISASCNEIMGSRMEQLRLKWLSGLSEDEIAQLPRVKIVTDGSCIGNPGPGGWAAILIYGKHRKEISGHLPGTTNNRAEFLAVLEGIKALRQPCGIEIVTDSSLVRGCLVQGWRRKNAILRAIAESIEDVIRCNGHALLDVALVRGHAGDRLNERADRLAQEAAHETSH